MSMPFPKMRSRLKHLKKFVYTRNTQLIFRSISPPAIDTANFELVPKNANPDYVYNLYVSFGRQKVFGDENLKRVIANRLSSGMKFFELKEKGNLLASTWVHEDGFRFLDEFAYRIEVPRDAIWLRDIFVDPQRRGKDLFGRVIGLLFKIYAPLKTAIYSDSRKENSSSLRAHHKAKFQTLGSVRVVKIFNRIFIRDALPGGLQSKGGVRDEKSVIYCNPHIRRSIQENLM